MSGGRPGEGWGRGGGGGWAQFGLEVRTSYYMKPRSGPQHRAGHPVPPVVPRRNAHASLCPRATASAATPPHATYVRPTHTPSRVRPIAPPRTPFPCATTRAAPLPRPIPVCDRPQKENRMPHPMPRATARAASLMDTSAASSTDKIRGSMESYERRT